MMDLGCVSIIPGARRPLEPKRDYAPWTRDLKVFLESEGFSPVKCFDWQGGLLSSYSPSLHAEYASHLRDMAASAGSEGIAILAKSHGAVIAEAAMRALEKSGTTPHVRVFLRIGTADRRKKLPLRSVANVVDLMSTDDLLYRLGLILEWTWTPRIQRHRYGESVAIERHIVSGYSHGDFNYPSPIIINGKYRYSNFRVYSHILQSGSLYKVPVDTTKS